MLPAMSSLTRAVLVMGLTATVGCGPLSPEAQSTNKYLRELQPLLVENGHLAERILILSAAVYNEDGGKDDLVTSWSTEVVPLAEHLHHQSQFLTAPDDWSARHSELVVIWGDRALAYRSLSEALILADVEEWEKGRSEATQVKLREEEWFKEVNQILANTGQQIDPTP